MKLESCCVILKLDWVQETLSMALFRLSKPLQKHLIMTLKCDHETTACVQKTKETTVRINEYHLL